MLLPLSTRSRTVCTPVQQLQSTLEILGKATHPMLDRSVAVRSYPTDGFQDITRLGSGV